MRKRLFLLIGIIMFSLFSSCSNKETLYTPENRVPDEPQWVTSTKYTLEKWDTLKTGVESPNAILVRETDILVCDAKKNAIIVLNLQGEYQYKIGKLGIAPLEFNNPTSITTDGEIVYIIDAFNGRIQILTSDLKYIGSIELTDFENGNRSWFTDISYSKPDNCLYLGTNNNLHKYAKLYKVTLNTEIEIMEYGFYGFLSPEIDTAYALSAYELIKMKNGEGAAAGTNELYEIIDGTLIKVGALPYMYAPTDFVVADEYFYTMSSGWGSFDKFNMDGTYIETLLKDSEIIMNCTYIAMINENQFLLSGTADNCIYVLQAS